MQIINIDWDGPYSMKDLKQLSDSEVDFGVYQIYGCHPIYDSDKLLYIGQANKQTFGVRIKQERWPFNPDPESIKIYIGRIAGETTPDLKVWEEEINLAEKLLIYTHAPAYNSQNILRLRNEKDLFGIHVLNWGHHRDLLPEVSGYRWTSQLDELEYDIYKYKD